MWISCHTVAAEQHLDWNQTGCILCEEAKLVVEEREEQQQGWEKMEKIWSWKRLKPWNTDCRSLKWSMDWPAKKGFLISFWQNRCLGPLPLLTKRFVKDVRRRRVDAHLDNWVFGRSPGRHYFSMEPPSAVGVDEVSLNDKVLQHVLRLVLAAQHQPSEAVVDGQRLRDEQTSMTGHPSAFKLAHKFPNSAWNGFASPLQLIKFKCSQTKSHYITNIWSILRFKHVNA